MKKIITVALAVLLVLGSGILLSISTYRFTVIPKRFDDKIRKLESSSDSIRINQKLALDYDTKHSVVMGAIYSVSATMELMTNSEYTEWFIKRNHLSIDAYAHALNFRNSVSSIDIPFDLDFIGSLNYQQVHNTRKDCFLDAGIGFEYLASEHSCYVNEIKIIQKSKSEYWESALKYQIIGLILGLVFGLLDVLYNWLK